MAIEISEFEVSGAPEVAPPAAAPQPGTEQTDRLSALHPLQQQLTALREQAARLLAD
jgi:hypothetical protein